MRKFISLVLTILIALNVAIIGAFSLGVNKIEHGTGLYEGYTYIYVSSDKIDDYIKDLQQETDQCFAEYKDWYEEHPWKGVFHLSHVFTFPIIAGLISYFPLKKLLLTSNVDAQQSRSNMLIRYLLFNIAFSAISAFAGFVGLLFTKNNLPNSKWLDCVFLKDTNDVLSNDLQNFDERRKAYGVEITCRLNHPIKWFERPFLALWQTRGECIVNPQ